MLRRLLWGIAAVVCIAVVGVVIWRWQARATSAANSPLPLEGLKNFGAVPDFTFTERSGRKISLVNLKGKVWVAQFFYTHCTDICPLTVAQMGLLHLEYLNDPEFRQAIRLVSITVDPERDTPAVLRRYAEHFSADPDLWLFLTGRPGNDCSIGSAGFQIRCGRSSKSSRGGKKDGRGKGVVPQQPFDSDRPPSADPRLLFRNRRRSHGAPAA